MASLELLEAIQKQSEEIESNASEDAILDCIALCELLVKDNEIDVLLESTKKAKDAINKYLNKSVGLDIWEFEKELQNYAEEHWIVNCYYKILKLESFWKFDSFIYYMERLRPWRKRFYQVRRETLFDVVDDLENLEARKTRFYGLSMPSRVGKALAFDTPILTRNGWKKHGELTTKDEVLGSDGKFQRVIAIHNPCEMEYRVTFTNGQSFVCHGNHEWNVHDRCLNKVITIDTNEMAKTYRHKDGHSKYTLEKRTVMKGEHKTLNVDPYTLGVWLGDGRNTDPDICGPKSDCAIVEKILSNGYPMSWHTTHKTTGVEYYGFKELRFQLQSYGMCYSRHRTAKHIPDDYFTASIEQRLWLLAGLLDTDGTLCKKEHRYHFSTTEPALRDGFVRLVSTFGWRTCVVEYEPKVSSSGIVGRKPVWAISFNPTIHIPCQLERKQLFEFSKQRRIGIKTIERCEKGITGNCITVENPDGIYLAGDTLLPTHNSTLCIFFLSWIAMKRPNSHSAMGGHSGLLAKGFYKELCNLMFTEEYTFHELFDFWHPEYKGTSFPVSKSADEFTITLGDPDRFATITCRGIDGTWTGAIDVSADGYLYIDDLVRDREHSLSPVRMENTFQEYLNKMVDRKNDGARELMVGTLWNVLDPLERMNKKYKDDAEYKFRRIPALNENDESNFNYEINGFSTQYYRDMRERLDHAEWMAKFQQQPYVREGLIFPADELRYFNGVLPEGDHRIVAACDVALGGDDNLSMPIGAEYENGDVYIFSWIFRKGAKEITAPLVIGGIIGNKIRQIRFEANVGGDLYCSYIDEQLQKLGYACSCTHKRAPNNIEKVAKIDAYSGDVKRKFIFLDDRKLTPQEREEDAELGITRYARDSGYQAAMDEFTSFVSIGKNEHDDAADGITQLAMYVEKPMGNHQTRIIQSPL